jgi:hypothetical protein
MYCALVIRIVIVKFGIVHIGGSGDDGYYNLDPTFGIRARTRDDERISNVLASMTLFLHVSPPAPSFPCSPKLMMIFTTTYAVSLISLEGYVVVAVHTTVSRVQCNLVLAYLGPDVNIILPFTVDRCTYVSLDLIPAINGYISLIYYIRQVVRLNFSGVVIT